MSQLTPEKVKQHLEKLGYIDIPKKELQKFTRDLQRLVNFEASSRSGTERSTRSQRRKPDDGGRRKPRPELESIPEEHSQATPRSRCRSQMGTDPRHGWAPEGADGTNDFFEKVGRSSRRARSLESRSDSYDSMQDDMRELRGDDSSVSEDSVRPPPPIPTTPQRWLPEAREGAEELIKAGFRVRCDMLSRPIRSSPGSRHRWYTEVRERMPVPTSDPHYGIRTAVRLALDTYDFKPRPMPKPTDVWQGPLLRTQPDASYKMNHNNNLTKFPLNVRESRNN